MPEAVIVATARTPIGRANKGSLVECRPDDLSAFSRGAGPGAVVRDASQHLSDRCDQPSLQPRQQSLRPPDFCGE